MSILLILFIPLSFILYMPLMTLITYILSKQKRTKKVVFKMFPPKLEVEFYESPSNKAN